MELQKQFFYKHDFYQEISNPDESYLGTLNLNFSNYPDNDTESDIYAEESKAFENKVIQYINSNWETSLKELNENGHYTATYNALEKWESDKRETQLFDSLAASELIRQLNK